MRWSRGGGRWSRSGGPWCGGLVVVVSCGGPWWFFVAVVPPWWWSMAVVRGGGPRCIRRMSGLELQPCPFACAASSKARALTPYACKHTSSAPSRPRLLSVLASLGAAPHLQPPNLRFVHIISRQIKMEGESSVARCCSKAHIVTKVGTAPGFALLTCLCAMASWP